MSGRGVGEGKRERSRSCAAHRGPARESKNGCRSCVASYTYAIGLNLTLFHSSRRRSMSVMFVGEGLYLEDGDLNNVAHIDLLIGSKDGPVGTAFANALANQSAGHTNLLAVVSPIIQAKPATAMITKVTLKGSKQVMQMFGPAQAAVAR